MSKSFLKPASKLSQSCFKVVPQLSLCCLVLSSLCQSFGKVFSKFSQICPMVVLKLSQSRPRAVSKLSPNGAQETSMFFPKGVQMQSPIGAKWSPSCPKRWPSVVSVLCSSQLVPGGLHFRYHLAMRCIKWVSLILLQRLECLLLLRNGVIGKSKVKDWWRVGHYLVGMAITAPCDHFVDSWQPLLDYFGFYAGHVMSTWWLFGELCESI